MASYRAAQPDDRNFGLDLLRAIAIGGVLFSHAFWSFQANRAQLYLLGHTGFYGVELFFVLSGFLIGTILLKEADDLGDVSALWAFFKRRWFRTLPNYWVFLILNIPIYLFILGRDDLWAPLPHFLTFTQSLFNPSGTRFYSEAWSLSVEEWFYLIFPLTVAVCIRLRVAALTAFFVAGGVLYFGSTYLRMVYAGGPTNNWVTVIRVLAALRLDAPMTGVFAAIIAYRLPNLFFKNYKAVGIMGILLLAFCYWSIFWNNYNNDGFFARTYRFNFVSLGFAMLLPAALMIKPPSNKLLKLGAEYVARWSYSAYLINLPVSYFVSRALLPDGTGSNAVRWSAFVLFFFVTLSLSALWYKVFEKPTTELRDRWLATKGRPASAQA